MKLCNPLTKILSIVVLLSFTKRIYGQQVPPQAKPNPYACTRSPTVGSPINYIHKGLEQFYSILYNNEIGAIPRMILDHTDIPNDTQHYGWYFPSSTIRSMVYLSLGSLQSQRPSLENLFYTEVDDKGDPNAGYNQVLKILKATRIDRQTKQPVQFILDKNPNTISDYTVQCGNIKQSFSHFQKHFKNDFSQAISYFS